MEIAILLFQQEKITLDTASRFLGMNQLEFQQVLGSRNVSIHDGIEDYRQDFKALKINRLDQGQEQSNQAEILQRIEQRRTFSPAQYRLPDTLALLQEDRAQ